MEWELGKMTKRVRGTRCLTYIGKGRSIRERAHVDAVAASSGAWRACRKKAGAQRRVDMHRRCWRAGQGAVEKTRGGGPKPTASRVCWQPCARRVSTSWLARVMVARGTWKRNAGERAQSISQRNEKKTKR